MWIMADKVRAAGLGPEWESVTEQRDQYIADLQAAVAERDAKIEWLLSLLESIPVTARVGLGNLASPLTSHQHCRLMSVQD